LVGVAKVHYTVTSDGGGESTLRFYHGCRRALSPTGCQGTLPDNVIRYFDDPASNTATANPPSRGRSPVVEGDHGRIETRTATVGSDIKWLQDDHHGPVLTAIATVDRTPEAKTKTTSETESRQFRVARWATVRKSGQNPLTSLSLPPSVMPSVRSPISLPWPFTFTPQNNPDRRARNLTFH
jgi:hypothetical protein